MRPATLIVSGDEFLASEALDAVRREAAEAGYAREEVDASDAGALLYGLGTPSLFDAGRLIVVRDAQDLPSDSVDLVARWAADPGPGTALALVASGTKADKLVKALGKTVHLVKAAAPPPWESAKWLADRVRAKHRKISSEAAQAIVDAVGTDLRELAAGADQLLLDLEGAIDVESVRSRFHGIESKVYEFVDAVLDRDGPQALMRLRSLIENGENAIGIVTQLARQLRVVAAVKDGPRISPEALARGPARSSGRTASRATSSRPRFAAPIAWSPTPTWPSRASRRTTSCSTCSWRRSPSAEVFGPARNRVRGTSPRSGRSGRHGRAYHPLGIEPGAGGVSLRAGVRGGQSSHLVHFYESGRDLAARASGYLENGFRRHDAVVVIATPEHLAAFESALALAGVDTAAARLEGRYVSLDAAATLAGISPGGRPDAAAFDAVVGELVRTLAGEDRRVCAYGEMVALLWDAGDVTGALELEGFWNDLLDGLSFSLFCAYPAAVLANGHADVVADVCRLHSGLITGEVREESRQFDCHPTAPGKARRFVTGTLGEWGLGALSVDASVVVTELATNAILHAGSEFVVTVSTRGGKMRVSVRDASRAEPVIGASEPRDTSGRGLVLVAALSSRWGSEENGNGKVVWAEFSHEEASS